MQQNRIHGACCMLNCHSKLYLELILNFPDFLFSQFSSDMRINVHSHIDARMPKITLYHFWRDPPFQCPCRKCVAHCMRAKILHHIWFPVFPLCSSFFLSVHPVNYFPNELRHGRPPKRPPSNGSEYKVLQPTGWLPFIPSFMRSFACSALCLLSRLPISGSIGTVLLLLPVFAGPLCSSLPARLIIVPLIWISIFLKSMSLHSRAVISAFVK